MSKKKEKRDRGKLLLLTKSEIEAFDKFAENLGVNTSVWMRSVLRREIGLPSQREPEPKDGQPLREGV